MGRPWRRLNAPERNAIASLRFRVNSRPHYRLTGLRKTNALLQFGCSSGPAAVFAGNRQVGSPLGNRFGRVHLQLGEPQRERFEMD